MRTIHLLQDTLDSFCFYRARDNNVDFPCSLAFFQTASLHYVCLFIDMSSGVSTPLVFSRPSSMLGVGRPGWTEAEHGPTLVRLITLLAYLNSYLCNF